MQTDSGHLKALDVGSLLDVEMAARNPGLVFRIGERVKLKDGDFRIKSFGKRMLVLEGLPGTRLKTS